MKFYKFAIRGVPVLPLLLMSVITVGAVIVATSRITGTVTVTATFSLAAFEFNTVSRTCSSIPFGSVNFGSVNDTFVGTIASSDPNGDSYFCLRNTGTRNSVTFGGVGAYSVSGAPSGMTIGVFYNDGSAQQDIKVISGWSVPFPVTLSPGQDTVQYAFANNGGNGYLHIDATFDGTQPAGTYSGIVVTINGS